MKLLAIGDNVCDVYLHLETMYPGGQALNVAVYGNMLGQDSAYYGVFGKDDVSEHILSVLDELKVDYSHCIHRDGENGYAVVTIDKSERLFLGGNKGGVAKTTRLTFGEDMLGYIKNFSVIHTSNNSFIDEDLPLIKETGVPISYDFSTDWVEKPEWMKEICQYCSFAFLSLPDDALESEIDKYISQFHDAGCPNVIATFGKKGSFFSDGTNIYKQMPHLVKAVDTLGAGDSFAAAFLVNYYNALEANPDAMIPGTEYYETSITNTLVEAAKFAAKTCTVCGAFDYGKAISVSAFEAKMASPSFIKNNG